MEGNLSKHWLYKEVLRYRILASYIWTGVFSLITTFAFLFFWLSSPKSHFYIVPIPEYFVALVSMRTWMVSFGISFVAISYVWLHFKTYKVEVKLKTTFLESLLNIFRPKNILASIFSGVLGATFMILTFSLTNSSYSTCIISCTDGLADAWCLNEKLFIAMMYGFVLGLSQSMKGLDDDSCTLDFNCVQPSQLQTIRYQLTYNLKTSIDINYKFIRIFLPSYYFLAKHLFLYTSDLMGLFSVEYDCVVSPFKPFVAVSVTFSLFLSGTFLLLVKSLSWELLNLFLVKNYSFLLQTLFADKQDKLLVANLNKEQPSLVQHIAFNSLCGMVCNSSSCRKQLFDVPPDSNVKSSNVHWNIVADECLERVKNFNEELKMCYYEVANGTLFREKKPKNVKSNQPTVNKLSTVTPNLKRRAIHLGLNNSQLRSNTSGMGSMLSGEIQATSPSSQSLHSQSIQSPRLWTVQSPMSETRNSPFIEKKLGNSLLRGLNPQKSFQEQKHLALTRLISWLKSFSWVTFFFQQQPDRHAANLFTNFHIVRWSIRILSVLAAKSVVEDVYGVVQCRLDQVLQELLELLTSLERNCKMPITCQSPAVVSLIRRQHSLKAECISSIYRISTAFPQQLDSLHLKPEHTRRLALFAEFKC